MDFPKTRLSDVAPKKRIWRNVFGVPKSQLGLYHELVSAVQIPVSFHLDAELDSKKLASGSSLLRRLQGNIPDLITFNPSLIDQEPWEKVSAVKVSEDQKVAEVSLLYGISVSLAMKLISRFQAAHLLVLDAYDYQYIRFRQLALGSRPSGNGPIASCIRSIIFLVDVRTTALAPTSNPTWGAYYQESVAQTS